ncbi:MAG: hypothetical protein ACFFB5_16800 [Promethearchaeota archaeon]
MTTCQYCHSKDAVRRWSLFIFDRNYCSFSCWFRGSAPLCLSAGVVVLINGLLLDIFSVLLTGGEPLSFSGMLIIGFFNLVGFLLIFFGIIGLITRKIAPSTPPEMISEQITELKDEIDLKIQQLDLTQLDFKQWVERYNNMKVEFIEGKILPQYYLKWLRDFKKTIGTKLQEF